jgi:uncharacterized protein
VTGNDRHLAVARETASMTTRDGVRLDADIYRPSLPGPLPVLLMRQPYGRAIASTVAYSHPVWYARQGYIVVVQDVRGRGTSGGEFSPFEAEADDGRQAVEWAAAIQGSSGKVGMYGCSYQGATQLFAASGRPAPLAAICPAAAAYDVFQDFAYEGGALRLAGGIGWALQLAVEGARRAADADAHQALLAAARALPLNDPIPALPRVLQKYRRYSHFADWTAHCEQGPYWDRLSPRSHIARIDVPALHIGGWYDYLLGGTLSAFREMASRCASPQRLIIGPWTHFPWSRKAGPRDFGPGAVNDIDVQQIRWFDHWLKGRENGVAGEPAVRLFEMGAGAWRTFERWPAAETSGWYLTSRGRAAIDPEDGSLGSSPASRDEDAIVHDPWRPVPALGGHVALPGGPAERSEIDARGDVLTYTSAPLQQDLRLAGDVALELWCASDRASFDVSAVLSQVHSDGRVLSITQGHRRVAKGAATTPLSVSLRATCCRIPRGERLRLSIAGASFPAFDVNPGSGVAPAQARLIDQLHTTLFVQHGAGAPSRLVLPGK